MDSDFAGSPYRRTDGAGRRTGSTPESARVLDEEVLDGPRLTAEQFLQRCGDGTDLAGFSAGFQAEEEFGEPWRDSVLEQRRTTVIR